MNFGKLSVSKFAGLASAAMLLASYGAALAAVNSQSAVTPSAMSVSEAAAAAKNAPTTGKVKYRAGKDVNFEELLIQGELKRPELSVVTGNTQPGSDGLLRLRENFTDRITTDVGEELP